MLLEKAYAKMYGSYYNIRSGHNHHAIRDLTGAPGDYLINSSIKEDELWDKLIEFEKSNYFVAAGSHGEGEVKNASGIRGGHAYSILHV